MTKNHDAKTRDRTRRSRRLRAMSALGAVLPDPHASRGIPWSRLVGRTLALETIAIGVDDRGRLRVMAHNETGCRELLARRDHVLSAWNAWANDACERLADELVCWVRRVPDAPQRSVEEGTALRIERPPVAGRDDDPSMRVHRANARAMLGGDVADPAVAAALLDACARSLRAAQRDEHGDST